jgi:DUF2075 family protein
MNKPKLAKKPAITKSALQKAQMKYTEIIKNRYFITITGPIQAIFFLTRITVDIKA